MRPASLRHNAVPLLVLCGVLGLAYYAFFGRYAFDDSFVGYSIAQSILAGQGFSFNGGDRMLSTSAPLAVPLYVALALLFRVTIVQAGQVFSAAALAVVAFGSYALARRYCTAFGALAAAITLTCSPFTLLLWSHETLLYAASTIAGLLLYVHRRFAAAALVLGAAALFRGEALLLLPIVWYADARARGTRAAVSFAGLSLAPYAAWALGATAFFGSPFSQTVASKHAQLRYPEIAPYLYGLRDYAARMYALTPTRLWIAALETSVALAGAVAVICGAFRRRYAAVALWVAVTSAAYVLLQLPFYFWFCVQLGAGMAACVAMLWEQAQAPRFPLLLRFGRLAAIAVAAINAGFLALQIAHPDRKYISYDWIIMPSIRANAYRSLGTWFARREPGASVAYAEFGQVHYYSHAKIVDYLGIVTPGAAAHLARGNAIWTFKRYRPQFVVGTTNFAYFVAPTEYDWFSQAYAQIATLRFSGDPLRSIFAIYELRRPSHIPPADERDDGVRVDGVALRLNRITFAFTPSRASAVEVEARVVVPARCAALDASVIGRGFREAARRRVRPGVMRVTMLLHRPLERDRYAYSLGGCEGLAAAPPVLLRKGVIWLGKPAPSRGSAADAFTLYWKSPGS